MAPGIAAFLTLASLSPRQNSHPNTMKNFTRGVALVTPMNQVVDERRLAETGTRLFRWSAGPETHSETQAIQRISSRRLL